MNLLLTHPEIPENARVEIPAELRADQKEWNKVKKEAESASQRRYRLEISVLNEEKAKVEQCSKCRKSNESKTRSFVRVRASHLYCKNRSVSLPVKFGCIPSHQDSRPKELFIEIKLISEGDSSRSPERLEFYSMVPLRFRKHKRKSSNSKITSPITSPVMSPTMSPITSPMTSPRGALPQQWALPHLPQEQAGYWGVEEASKPIPIGYPPPNGQGPTFQWPPLSHDMPNTQFNNSYPGDHERTDYPPYTKNHAHDHMIESPPHSPSYSMSSPGSPRGPLSGYSSPPYDDFDFTGAAQLSARSMEAGRSTAQEIEQLPLYLQKLRLQELEDKNRRLEDENVTCKRMLDECKRVLKTATMEIERLTRENQRANYKLQRRGEEVLAERRAKESYQKQLEELKAQTSHATKAAAPPTTKFALKTEHKDTVKGPANPFTVKEDLDAVRRGLKPTQGGQDIPQMPQFTFGVYNSPSPTTWS